MRSIGLIGLAIAASVLVYSGKTLSMRQAVAQSGPSYQLPPLGDVWITAGQPRPFFRGAVEATSSVSQDVPTGDVWPTGL